MWIKSIALAGWMLGALLFAGCFGGEESEAPEAPQISMKHWDLSTAEDLEAALPEDLKVFGLHFDGQKIPYVLYSVEGTITLARRVGTGNWEISPIEGAGTGDWDVGFDVTADGTAHATYLWSGALNHSFKAPGGEWQTEVASAPEHGYAGEFNDLALGPDGTPHVCYFATNHELLVYAQKQADGTWVVEEVADVGDSDYCRIAVDQADGVHIAFRMDKYDPTDGLNLANKAAGGEWQIGLPGEQANQFGWVPNLQVDSGGALHVLSKGFYVTEKLAYFTNSAGTWLEEDPVTQAEWDHPTDLFSRQHRKFAVSTAIALDPQDGVHILYGHYPGDAGAFLMYSFRTGPGQWVPEVVQAGLSGSEYQFALGVDADGFRHIVWRTSDPNPATPGGAKVRYLRVGPR